MFLFRDFFLYHYDYVSTPCPLPSLLLGPAHLGVPQLFLPSPLTVCISEVANQGYETLCGPHFLPSRQNPSLMAHKDKRGLYCWRVVGVLGKAVCEVLRWNYPILWFSERGSRVNDWLNGFLPLLLSLFYIWRQGFLCSLVTKCTGTMRTSKFRAYLSFSCAVGYAGTPGLFNALGDKGRESECACGRRWGLRHSSIFNLCTVNTRHS